MRSRMLVGSGLEEGCEGLEIEAAAVELMRQQTRSQVRFFMFQLFRM